MYWQKRLDRENKDEDIENAILEVRSEHESYGYRRIHKTLEAQGMLVNKKKVQRIIQKLGIQTTSFTRKSRKYSSYKGKVGKTAPNRLNRRFKTSILHQKITTDTSEFKYYEKDAHGKTQIKKLYLDPFMDLYNLEIISYGISSTPSAKSIGEALEKAIIETSDCKYRRTFHSDQGWAYQMKSYTSKLKENMIFQSMSRKGNCFDNSPIENFFGILKQEMYYGNVYDSYNSLKCAIEEYIKYYNEERIKDRLEWLSPIQYKYHMQVA